MASFQITARWTLEWDTSETAPRCRSFHPWESLKQCGPSRPTSKTLKAQPSFRQRWSCRWRDAVARGLFVCVGQRNHFRIVVGAAQKRYSRGNVLGRETGRNSDGWHVDEKCIQGRSSPANAGVSAIGLRGGLDETRRTLHRTVDDGVEAIVRHHLQNIGQ